jgi:hypothetical protein
VKGVSLFRYASLDGRNSDSGRELTPDLESDSGDGQSLDARGQRPFPVAVTVGLARLAASTCAMAGTVERQKDDRYVLMCSCT